MKIGFPSPVTGAGRISPALLALLASLAPGVSADGLDQYQVRRLVEQGEILPLDVLLARHRERLNGRIIDLELEYEHGLLVYEIEMVDERGRVRDYLIDAKDGTWLGEE